MQFDRATHTVVGLSGTCVRLRDEHGGTTILTIAHLQAAPDFHLVTTSASPSPTNELEHLDLLKSLPPATLAQARWWEAHVLEVQTGLPPTTTPDTTPTSAGDGTGDGTGENTDGNTDDAARRARYDPSSHTLAQRDQAKAEELTALGTPVSAMTIRRRRHAYTTSGLWGLIDQRATRPTGVGRVDERVIAATRQAIAEQAPQSTGTRSRLRRRVEQLLAQQHDLDNNTENNTEADPAPVVMPSTATFYRLLHRLDTGAHTFTAATTRRSLANRPATPFGSVPAIRPGQLVQIDTTTLDVLVLLDNHDTKTNTETETETETETASISGENTGGEVTGRVELTMLVDVASRTICTGVLRPVGTKAVDAALLLARSVVPEPMRPGWADALRMRASRLPHSDLAAIDARLADAAAKPVIVPETIVCDRGTIFLSETFLSACARLGISLQPAHPYTPTDKAVVERTFSSINTLFCQYVAGYTGRDVTRRGRDLDNQPLWTLPELQDLFDQWVLVGWQPRPHNGLRHPDIPRTALSPNEAYAALTAAAGYLPLALTADDYLELLPVAWRQITAEGIRLNSLTYDCAPLNPYRGQHSGTTARRGRWAVHYDPYNLTQIWLRDTKPGAESGEPSTETGTESDAGQPGWIEVPWVHRDRAPAPFADFTLRHTRQQLAARGQNNHDQLAVAGALEQLLDHAGAGPDKRGRRITARTRAATTTHPHPETETGPADDLTDQAGQEPTETALPDVVPYEVFDAHAEARRLW